MNIKIKLTKRQHELLYMDIVEITDLEKNPEDTLLVIELENGNSISVTNNLLEWLSELTDRDDVISEQNVYKRIQRKAKDLVLDSFN